MPIPCPRFGHCQRASATSDLGALMAEPGFSAAPLSASVAVIAREFPSLDTAVAVTANSCAVMTEIGTYATPRFAGDGLCPAKGRTGLRIHCGSVATALAVDRPDHGHLPCSLQFFDSSGAALHKCFMTGMADDFAFAELTRDWIGEPPSDTSDQRERMPVTKGWLPFQPDGSWWRGRDSAFQFDGVLRDNGLARRASLPSWGESFAWQVDRHILFDLMTLLREVRMPLAINVGNAAFVQTHRGALDAALRHDNAVRLIAESCSISLNLEEIEELWVTRFDAAGRAGYVLEAYDWRYHCVVQLSGLAATDGHAGRYWQDQLCALPRLRRSRAMPGKGRQ